ncbi:MAG: hypothetical protein ACC648_00530 [Thiohalobacterales bacterium]
MHLKNRQTRYQLCSLVLLAAVFIPCAGADPVTGQQPQAPPVTEPAERKVPAGPAQQPPAPAPTFTPSEQIGADSAVSFPVDI